METFFLFFLIFLMMMALATGFPVAFALPGAAIISITIAGLAGYIFTGNSHSYFIHDGPLNGFPLQLQILGVLTGKLIEIH
jgi:hypothetical protein